MVVVYKETHLVVFSYLDDLVPASLLQEWNFHIRSVTKNVTNYKDIWPHNAVLFITEEKLEDAKG